MGRPLGALNKRTVKRLEAMEAGGQMPLDYMLATMRDPKAKRARRDWAANAAAPYCHQRLAATEAKITGRVTLEQLVAGSLELEKKGKP